MNYFIISSKNKINNQTKSTTAAAHPLINPIAEQEKIDMAKIRKKKTREREREKALIPKKKTIFF